MSFKIGQKAPNFTAFDQLGVRHRLSDYKGRKLILFFYPKDMTPGCTTEAGDFRDSQKILAKMGVDILGVSKDSSERHQKFIEKNGLNFPLLVDEEADLCKAYGVWQEKKNFGKTYMGIVRTTVIIDEKGKIQELFEKVRVKDHVQKIVDLISG